METIREPVVEYGVAKFALPGQGESGDDHLVCFNQNGVLIAAIDGIGHGEEASEPGKAATSILKAGVEEPIISLLWGGHEKPPSTPRVLLSVASLYPVKGMMALLR